MELHEAGPGLVEQDVVAEMTDALQYHLGAVNCAVIGALLHHGDAERARLLPGIVVCHKRVVADTLAQRIFIERVPVHRADEAPRVTYRWDINRDAAGSSISAP